MFSLHRPGLPEDLPDPRVLWARWGLVAVLSATTDEEGRANRTGHWFTGGALRLDDGGNTRWTLADLGEGRYVLHGDDDAGRVRWHRSPVDVLAGGPDWLPYGTLRPLIGDSMVGCVYWHEDGAWHRAPYPADLSDDGLNGGMRDYVHRPYLLELLVGEGWIPAPLEEDEAAEVLDLAERYALTGDRLDRLVADADEEYADDWDLSAMRRALALSGLAGQG
jgi:hypothetical protein